MSDLKKMSEAATGGKWSVIGSSGDEVIIATSPPQLYADGSGTRTDVVSSSEWTHMSDEDAEFVCALVNAYRAGQLVVSP
jgi:hypothetical protein